MEQMNKIELVGRIGNAYLNKVGDTQVLRISVATDYVFKDRSGTPVIETTWHNAVVWEGKNAPDLMAISRGRTVHLTGRIRQNRYMAADGTEKQVSEIYVNKNRWNKTLVPYFYQKAEEYLGEGERMASEKGFTDLSRRSIPFRIRFFRQGGKINDAIDYSFSL